jgi:hypothetical protein
MADEEDYGYDDFEDDEEEVQEVVKATQERSEAHAVETTISPATHSPVKLSQTGYAHDTSSPKMRTEPTTELPSPKSAGVGYVPVPHTEKCASFKRPINLSQSRNIEDWAEYYAQVEEEETAAEMAAEPLIHTEEPPSQTVAAAFDASKLSSIQHWGQQGRRLCRQQP